MVPMLLTMEIMAQERALKVGWFSFYFQGSSQVEGGIARDFLESKFDMERALNLGVVWTCHKRVFTRTLAVLADAHDECFALTRLADREDFSVNEFHDALERLLGS